ncbi:MAG TPA: hypothetical protein VNM90_07865, partial [Haliangium sp.]|nr:hypothetical protein [Haliangium sp.]
MLGAACAPAQRGPQAQAAPSAPAGTAAQAAQPGAPAATVQPGPAAQPAPGQRAAESEAARADAAVVAAIEQAVNQTRAARHDCWARAAADDFRWLAGSMTLRVVFGQPAAPGGPAVP